MSFVVEPRHRTGSGEPLVLLHGFTNSWRIWLPVIPALAERHDVLAPTVSGHCGADPLPEGTQPTVAALADSLESELDSAGIETAHFAGNSLGGWLALELARRGRARSVVALAPAGGWWDYDEKEERRLQGYFKRTRAMAKLSYPRVRPLLTRPGLRKLIFRDAMERGDRLKPGDALHIIQGVVECSIFMDFVETATEPAEGFETISCPVLIAWPEKDRILRMSRYAQPYHEKIPGSELVTLHGLGHVPMWDDPEVVARTILDFTARHGSAEEPPRPDVASRAAIG